MRIPRKEYMKIWNKENRVKITNQHAIWRKKNRAASFAIEIKSGARKQGIKYDLTKEWFKERLDSGICELSGMPFDMEGKRSRNSPSVDRINPMGSYTKDNCRLVLWSVNRALSNYGQEYLVGVFKKIIEREII